MRITIMAAAVAVLATPVLAQSYYYDPHREQAEQSQTDSLNRGELHQQHRLDRREQREQRRANEAYQDWQRRQDDWRRRDAEVQQWNRHDRFQRQNRRGSDWCYYPGRYNQGWSC